MDVIIMHSTTSLISQLKVDYPQFLFKQSDKFLWSPSEQAIYYKANNDKDSDLILHELSHALLNHFDYDRDIELVTMESQAWDKSIEIANKYNVAVNYSDIQSYLDTYRDWLHKRSTCPICTATGMQIKKDIYSCLACNHQWKVNEARIHNLKRYKITK